MTRTQTFRRRVARRLKLVVGAAINYDSGTDPHGLDGVDGQECKFRDWVVDEFDGEFERGVQEGMLRQSLQHEQMKALVHGVKLMKGGQ